jgi:hypothetical protein
MPQVPGARPFDEGDLANQLRFDPAALVHLALKALQSAQCPFKNLPETGAYRWGDSLTAEKYRIHVLRECNRRYEFLLHVRAVLDPGA